MGGHLFARASAAGQPTLSTPRMSKEVYERVKATYLQLLERFFDGGRVISLKEAPGKDDFGDIDFVVAYNERVDFIELARQVGAKAVVCLSPHMCALAVRKDSEALASLLMRSFTSGQDPGTDGTVTGCARELSKPVIYKPVNENDYRKAALSDQIDTIPYAHIDVEIVPSHLFNWREWHSSYGDLGGIIGQIVRNMGFTISTLGLSLRMQELDDAKKVPYLVQNVAGKDGMLFLSSDPEHVMQFLGLDYERYGDGLETLEELYAWIGRSRLISANALRMKRDTSSDRRKVKRDIFLGFFDDWLPQHTAKAEGELNEEEGLKVLRAERNSLAQDAISFFDKRAEYDAMHSVLMRSIKSATADHLLRPILGFHSNKEGKQLNEILRAFKRWVTVGDDGQMAIQPAPHSDDESELYLLLADDKQSLKDGQGTSEWVIKHWGALVGLERERVRAAQGKKDVDSNGT